MLPAIRDQWAKWVRLGGTAGAGQMPENADPHTPICLELAFLVAGGVSPIFARLSIRSRLCLRAQRR